MPSTRFLDRDLIPVQNINLHIILVLLLFHDSLYPHIETYQINRTRRAGQYFFLFENNHNITTEYILFY